MSIPTLVVVVPRDDRLFLFFGVLIGIVGGIVGEGAHRPFVDGARDMLGVALIIGIARGITVIMNNGMITDTVLNWAEQPSSDLGGVRFVLVCSCCSSRSRS